VHIAEADGQALPPVYGAGGMYVHVCILLKPMVKPFLLSMAPEVCATSAGFMVDVHDPLMHEPLCTIH
jgi:hypothetical protein